ncbi:MAG: glycerophosphodiester phosphodiesterase [Synergistaceae bacterium]|nr:glycerophosphodiester phosphodiesterase [Synergistota bacterium]NLM71009.1 glycerophosphodiester phosphodiesterase [Synergistaceae bacterium]
MLVFGHRGASGYAPENTLPAFELGIKQGCNGFEFDVQLTLDGVAVVIHDWDVDRTTDGSGEVRALDYEEILSLDAGSWFGPQFAGARVPRLEELFELIPEGMPLNLEMKTRPGDRPGLEEHVASLIQEYDKTGSVIVSSFNHGSLVELHRIAPEIKKGLLYEGVLVSPLAYGRRVVPDLLYSLHPCHDYVDSSTTESAHREGVKVACWTVNEPDRALELKRMGVDIAITNYPDRLLAALED